jgi:hypothetical protein
LLLPGFEGDSSAVSLRDVKRCLGLLQWFARHWPGGAKARTHVSLFGRSLVLAVAHVYLYRLSSSQMRGQFWSKVSSIVKGFGRSAEHIRCGELGKSTFPPRVLKRVQKNFADTFTVDAGIAMNEVSMGRLRFDTSLLLSSSLIHGMAFLYFSLRL